MSAYLPGKIFNPYSSLFTSVTQRRAALRSVHVDIAWPVCLISCRRVSQLLMPDNHSDAADQSAPDDLISFLKAIPAVHYRRGVGYPQ